MRIAWPGAVFDALCHAEGVQEAGRQAGALGQVRVSLASRLSRVQSDQIDRALAVCAHLHTTARWNLYGWLSQGGGSEHGGASDRCDVALRPAGG